MNTPAPSASNAKVLDLAQVSPPRLFFALLRQRFTGVLQLRQPPPHEGDRAVWFASGAPVFTDWADPTALLGEILVENGCVDAEKIAAALETMAAQGDLLGQTLLRGGLVDESSLSEALQQQCTRKLPALFALRSSQVTLSAGDHDLSGMARVDALALILAAVTQHYDETRIEGEMAEALRAPLRATAAFAKYQAHFRFRPEDQSILTALLGGTTFDELKRMRGSTPLRGAQLVYTLWACQMLRVGAAAKASPTLGSSRPAPPNPPSAASRPQQPARAPSPPPPPAPTKKSTGPTPQPATSASPKTKSPAKPPNSDDEKIYIAELGELEEKIASKAHAFELFGVPITAGRKEIRGAWGTLSRKFHPDGLQAKGWGHLRERVGHVFAALSEAHAILSDKSQREELRDNLEKGIDPNSAVDATATVRAAFEAEVIARDADRFLKASKFDRALGKYDEALKLNPDEPHYQVSAVWCRYQLSARSPADANHAELALSKALEDAPALAVAHFYRGMVLKDLGQTKPAIAAFKLAQRHNPNLIDAGRQLRALSMAANNPPKSKGFFGKRR